MRTENASQWSDARRIGVSPWIAVVVLIVGVFGSVSLVAASGGIDADSARYQAIGEFYLAKSEAAHSARWAAQADRQGDINADTARYQAMGEYYLAAAERGIEASAARYQAMGAFYLAMAGDDLLAANPELRLARAYAQDQRSVLLAANPELRLARAYAQGQQNDLLVANPELRLVRAYTEAQDLMALGSCSPAASEDRLAVNPELILVRNEAAC